jgi:nuclear transport factor 2 (NTF2) superfamily protein
MIATPGTIPPAAAAITAAQKVRPADAWNSRNPVRVSLSYTRDSIWRNRAEFLAPPAAGGRKFHWPLGRRPDDHPGLSELGL